MCVKLRHVKIGSQLLYIRILSIFTPSAPAVISYPITCAMLVTSLWPVGGGTWAGVGARRGGSYVIATKDRERVIVPRGNLRILHIMAMATQR